MVAILVVSSWIFGIDYDSEKQELTVTLDSGEGYTYSNVPPSVVEAFLDALRKGSDRIHSIRPAPAKEHRVDEVILNRQLQSGVNSLRVIIEVKGICSLERGRQLHTNLSEALESLGEGAPWTLDADGLGAFFFAFAFQINSFEEQDLATFKMWLSETMLDLVEDEETLWIGYGDFDEELFSADKLGALLKTRSAMKKLPEEYWHQQKLKGSSVRPRTTAFDFTVVFSEGLTPGQVAAGLEALAEYYRQCGGLGFDIRFEYQGVEGGVLVHA